MKRSIVAIFRSEAALTCFMVTDAVIAASGVVFAVQSIANNRSSLEVAGGVGVTVLGVSLGAMTIRGFQKRRSRPHMPSNG
jgi:hypothetical protein